MGWTRVGRSGIEKMHYDAVNQRLIVHWARSGFFVFGNVPPEEAANMACAPNPSAYFKRHIEPRAVRLPDLSSDEGLRPVGR